MIFSSWEYNFFFIITIIFYFFVNNKNIKYSIIFISSSYFYGSWSLEFLFLIYFLIIFNYLIGIKIISTKKKNQLFYFGIFVNLFILFYFKYLNFFLENINNLFSVLSLDLDLKTFKIILPLAISFYTFENISYLVDIRRGVIRPEKNLFFYACFIIFFPKLIAGPILRAREILPQFRKLNMIISIQNLKIGFWRIFLVYF